MSIIPTIITTCLVTGILLVALLFTVDSDIRNVRLGIVVLSVYAALAIRWAIKKVSVK